MIYLKTSIGIELRGSDMLISSLQSNFSGQVFTCFQRFPDYRLRNKQDLQQEINNFFKSNRLSKETIVLGIPRQDLILRYLDLPAEVVDNLKQVVEYQVQSLEPVDEDRYYYDYALLDNKKPQKRLAILLAMIRKAVLDEHLEFLHDLGIKPTIVTANPMALANIFLQNRNELQDKTFILADLASASLDLLAIHEGVLAYSREVPKESIRSWGDLILLEVDEAASKIRLGPDGFIEKIILAGESSDSAYEQIKAVIPECDLVKNYMGCKTPEENKTRLQEAASSLGLAYTGIARRPVHKINLLPPELRLNQTRWAYIPAAILGLAIIALLIALGLHEMVQQNILAGEMDQKITSLKAPVEKVHSLQKQAEEMETQITAMEKTLKARDMNLEALQELTTILPPDTYLTTYTYKEGTITIGGMSGGSTSDLIQKLEKSSLLKDVVPKGPVFKNAATGKYQFNFEMKLER
jgi:Tfp pilus assembly protein PilN